MKDVGWAQGEFISVQHAVEINTDTNIREMVADKLIGVCLAGAMGMAYEDVEVIDRLINDPEFAEDMNYSMEEEFAFVETMRPELDCIIEAITVLHPDWDDRSTYSPSLMLEPGMGGMTRLEAWKHLRGRDPQRERQLDSARIHIIARWNDEDDRTLDEVVDVLMKAEDIHGGG